MNAAMSKTTNRSHTARRSTAHVPSNLWRLIETYMRMQKGRIPNHNMPEVCAALRRALCAHREFE